MYAIEFYCEESGEHGWEGPYETWQDAICNYDYPGYGEYGIKEVSDEEALEAIHAEIDIEVDVWIVETDIDVDRDHAIIEKRWAQEANTYITDKRPGWELLKKELEK